MKAIQKLIHAGFAACALASASLPALSWTAWPDVDFEWDADAGSQHAAPVTPPNTQLAEASIGDSIRR